MAYYRDITVVDIKDWELGLQDAFEFSDGTRMEKNATMNPERKKKLFDTLFPLVQTDRGFQKILKKTDKIATRLNGRRFVLTEGEFKEYYHHDSGMFKPELDRHAEFEYVVQSFGKVRSELKMIKQRLQELDDPKDIPKIRQQVEDALDIGEGLMLNLKSTSEDFLDRVKNSCKCK